MNNLKRILSLALASVMVLGMMVVGASAAEFADSDKINADYADAVATMNALGIINGFEDETFRPEDTLTRAQMAMMLATIFRNGRTDFKFAVKENPSFTDVKSTDWYAGAVEYATNMGIINGRGNGIFDPASTVTATEAARMILNAMGYEQGEGDWQLNTVLQAEDAGLYKGMAEDDQLAGKLTREAAAQMLCNGVVNSPMADAEVVTETYYTLTYKLDITNDSEDPKPAGIKFESSTAAYLFASINDYDVVKVEKETDSAPKETLATKYLSLDTETGRVTAVTPQNNGAYTVVLDSSEDKTFTNVETNYSSLLGRNVTVMFKAANSVYGITAADTVVATIDGSEWATRVGETAADKKEFTLAATPRYCDQNGGRDGVSKNTIVAGSIVELINENNDAKIEAVRVTNKTVAVLDADPKVETDDDDETVVTIDTDGTDFTQVPADTVKGYENLKEGDTVLYVDLNGVTTFEKAEMVTGVITAIGPRNSYFTVGGNKLFVSKLNTPVLVTDDFKTEFNFFLDNGGNIIAMAEAGEAPVVDVKYAVTADFGYIKTGDTGAIGDTAAKFTYQVQLIFTDGTMDVVELAGYEIKDGDKYALKADTDNNIKALSDTVVGTTLKNGNKGHIVSYTINKNGQYILTEEGTDLTGDDITGGKAQFAPNVVGNKDTLFLVKVGEGDDAKLVIYNGVAELPSATDTLNGGQTFKKQTSDFVTLAYLEVDAFDGSTAEETAYFINNDTYVYTANGYEVQAIADGEIKTLVVDAQSWNTVKNAQGLKKVTYTDGKVTAVGEATGFTSADDVAMASEYVKATVEGEEKYYNVATDAVIYKLENGKATLVEPGKLAAALKAATGKHYEAEIQLGTDANADTILTMYVSVVAD